MNENPDIIESPKEGIENKNFQIFKESVENIGLGTIQSLTLLKEFLNNRGSGRNLFSIDSDTLDLAVWARSIGGYLIPNTKDREPEAATNWTENPRYKTSLYINHIIKIIERGETSPQEIEKQIMQYLQEENLQPQDIIENNEIVAIVENHFGQICDEAIRLEIDYEDDPIMQKLIAKRSHKKMISDAKVAQLRLDTKNRFAELLVLWIDKF